MEVAITGGTGFIGSHLSNELARRDDIDVTAVSRRPQQQVVPIDDSVELIQGDVLDPDSLNFEGVDAVIHLVAKTAVYKASEDLYHEIHVEGTRNVVDASIDAGVDHFIHMSALGVKPDGSTAYHRTKGDAEELVLNADLESTVFRPSIVFGEGDEFIPFTKRITTPYITGLPGGGQSRFQPIHVGDLVGMMADAVEGETRGDTLNIGGPQVLSHADITREIYRAENKPVKILPIPMPFVWLGLTVMHPVPFLPLGRDQYRALKLDNVVEGDNGATRFGLNVDEFTTLRGHLEERNHI